MSLNRTIQINCPQCNTAGDAEIWDSINTMVDPEMKAAVRDMSAFRWECKNCGHISTINYDCLYHQMEDKIMIAVCYDDDNANRYYEMFTKGLELKEDEFGLNGIDPEYRNRIVRSLNEFREKLYIIDAGYDDRIIEVYKIHVLAGFQEQYPEHKDVKMYFSSEQGHEQIEVYVDGKYFGAAGFDKTAYQAICNSLLKKLDSDTNKTPIIDLNWAMNRVIEDADDQR